MGRPVDGSGYGMRVSVSPPPTYITTVGHPTDASLRTPNMKLREAPHGPKALLGTRVQWRDGGGGTDSQTGSRRGSPERASPRVRHTSMSSARASSASASLYDPESGARPA